MLTKNVDLRDMKRCVRYIPTTLCVSEKIVLKQKIVLFNGLRPSYNYNGNIFLLALLLNA